MQTRQFSKDLISNIKSVQKSEADDFKKEWRASLLEIKKEIIEAKKQKLRNDTLMISHLWF